MEILKNDDLDTRRDVWKALDWLGDRGRFQFIKWCCSLVQGDAVKPFRTHEHYTTSEAYTDMLALLTQYNLDYAALRIELDRRASD